MLQLKFKNTSVIHQLPFVQKNKIHKTKTQMPFYDFFKIISSLKPETMIEISLKVTNTKQHGFAKYIILDKNQSHACVLNK